VHCLSFFLIKNKVKKTTRNTIGKCSDEIQARITNRYSFLKFFSNNLNFMAIINTNWNSCFSVFEAHLLALGGGRDVNGYAWTRIV
jgi:hypothetical protein